MIKKIYVVVALLFLGMLSAGPVLAAPTSAQLMRSNELSNKQKEIMSELRAGRELLINDYRLSGIKLTSEQSATLAKIIEPFRGSLLQKEQVDDLCQQIGAYINEEGRIAGQVFCEVYKEVLNIEYEKGGQE